MARLSADLVLSLKDNVSAGMKRVDGALGDIDRKVRATQRRTNGLGALGGMVAPAAVAYGAASAVKDFASAEREMNRIGITAGASAEETTKAWNVAQDTAKRFATSNDAVIAGLGTLVSSGRSLQDAMAFLPSVTMTAQAAGAEITDIAATADAVGRNFGIAGANMQNAFDILVEGGKAGQFELKDMASYLPSLAPAVAAIGYKGEEGLRKTVAMLQVLRAGTGSAEQAASSASNIFAKIESEETANKFKKFGVDLRKEMKRARLEGRDLVEFFVELTRKTVNGDLSKLPQIFSDMEMATGMRALLTNADMLAGVMKQLGSAAGSTQRDVNRVLGDTQSRIDTLSQSWSTFLQNMGAGLSRVAVPVFDAINKQINDRQSYASGEKKLEANGISLNDAMQAHAALYRRLQGADFSGKKAMAAFKADLERYGRDELKSPTADIELQVRNKERGPAVYPPLPADRAAPARSAVPTPSARPDPSAPVAARGPAGPPMPPRRESASDTQAARGVATMLEMQRRIDAAIARRTALAPVPAPTEKTSRVAPAEHPNGRDALAGIVARIDAASKVQEEGDRAATAAEAARQRIQSAFDVTAEAKVTVDDSDVDRAKSNLQGYMRMLSQVGPMARRVANEAAAQWANHGPQLDRQAVHKALGLRPNGQVDYDGLHADITHQGF